MPATILLVDDVRLYLELEKTFLHRHDVRLLTSGQGPQVLALARQKRPDVVVVDIRSPDETGLHLCREMKVDPSTRAVPVIAVTTEPGRRAAEAAGADALVFKPIAQREFLDAIRKFIPLRVRRHARLPVNLRFTFAVDNEIGQAFSRDVSYQGAFLTTEQDLPKGQRLNLRFHIPGEDEEIRCRAVVRNSREEGSSGALHRGIGVEFEEIDPSDQLRLEQFLANRLR